MNEGVYYKIAAEKTAALIRAAVMTGASVAGAAPAVLEAMSQYGLSLGLAFQLRDDIADAAGVDPLGELNAVAILGREAASARRDAEIAKACGALAGAGLVSEELTYLARSVEK